MIYFHKQKVNTLVISDSLLTCLVRLTKIVGRPTSNATLLSGLPIIENRLTVDLFPRAATRIDLDAKLKQFPLRGHPGHFPVPIVLVFRDGNGCLLTDLTDHNTAKLIDAISGSMIEISLDEIEESYSGRAFFVEPAFHFSARTSHASQEIAGKFWFWNAVKKLWSAYGEMLLASLLINLFAIAVPIFTMNVYDRVVPNHSFETLWVLASGIFIVFVFDALMRTLRGYFIDQAGKSVDLQVSSAILERVMGLKIADKPGSIGAFANTIQSFESVREFITSTTITILVDLPFTLIFLIIIGIIAGNLVWVTVVLIPLVLLFGFLLQKPLIQFTNHAHRYSAEKQAILYEILSGIEAVKTDCAENVMQSRWEQVVNLAAQIGLKLRFIANMGIFFSIFIQQLTSIVIIIFGVYKISNNELTTGALVACTILASRALAPMAQVATILTRYHQTKAALASLNTIMNLPIERPQGQTFLHLPHLRGELEFKEIYFQYSDRNFAALTNINFKINPGEHIGIIGRVGSGKTTLAKLIMGLLQPTRGSIYFDQMDQSLFDITELRKSIGYVPQDITLFYGTLRENLSFGAPNAKEENIHRAIEIAGIDEFVKPHIGNYDTLISEGGKSLSGGQRQLIALARAILHDPPIFILDEPSHSMDMQTENAIKNNLEKYFHDKTIILMTHRTSMLSLVSRILILDMGKIVMDGPKEIVLQALAEGKIKVPRAQT